VALDHVAQQQDVDVAGEKLPSVGRKQALRLGEPAFAEVPREVPLHQGSRGQGHVARSLWHLSAVVPQELAEVERADRDLERSPAHAGRHLAAQ
jgi:hypothetical protein